MDFCLSQFQRLSVMPQKFSMDTYVLQRSLTRNLNCSSLPVMRDTDMVKEQLYDVLNQDGLQPPIAQVSLA